MFLFYVAYLVNIIYHFGAVSSRGFAKKIKKMKKAEWNGQILYLLRETRYNITSMFVKGYELGIR